MIKYGFDSLKKVSWVERICEIRRLCPETPDELLFTFDGLSPDDVYPEHVATLACLIEELHTRYGHRIQIDKSPLGLFLWEKCRLRQYWGGKQNYSESPDEKILNLWRINPDEKDIQGTIVTTYLKNRFFRHKDLSAVANSLTEAYYNVFDHAEAGGNAFSMLMYEGESEVLRVAVCDFGMGIAKTVKDYLGEDISDCDAIRRAIQIDFSIKSKGYNAGLGLHNICSCCTEDDTLWIVGNSGALVLKNSEIKTFDLDFPFQGTLLFYSISLSHFEDEEIIEDLNL